MCCSSGLRAPGRCWKSRPAVPSSRSRRQYAAYAASYIRGGISRACPRYSPSVLIFCLQRSDIARYQETRYSQRPNALNNGQCGTPASRSSVMTARNSSRPIARVFRATAAPGCRDELLQRFHSSSAALVNSKAGCLKYRILEPVDASALEVVFESIWRDLDAVKMAFGDAWQQSYLPEGYSALMTAYSVHHFLVSESSTTEQFASEPRT